MLPKILLGLGLFATLFAFLIFTCKVPLGKSCKQNNVKGDVSVWGTLPDTEVLPIIQAFNPKAKTYSVRYKYVPEANFEQSLIEAIANQEGPDAIIAPQQIILSQADRIYKFPIAEKDFRDEFVDGASVFMTPGSVLALPITIEPMVLFYNRTLFSKHGIINPPTYWDEVATLATALTVRQNGQFVESAIALGTPSVSYSKDILMAMIGQLGQVPIIQNINQAGESTYAIMLNEPVDAKGEILPMVAAARFFTQFGDPGQTTYTWPQSQTADPADIFVSEKLAMYIGYSGEYQKLKARNPRGDFLMTTFPQTRGYNSFVTGMRMYAMATLKTSKNPVASLTVESQFASQDIALQFAAITGGVPATRAYAGTPALDPVVARGMLVAKGWLDRYSKDTTTYTNTMISDIINSRYLINDAVLLYVGRMRDLYNKQ